MSHSRRSAQGDRGEAHGAPVTRRLVYCTGYLQNGEACNTALAARVAGLIVFTHQGMEAVAERVHSIKCSRCGSLNRIDSPAPLVPLEKTA